MMLWLAVRGRASLGRHVCSELIYLQPNQINQTQSTNPINQANQPMKLSNQAIRQSTNQPSQQANL
jgi:hypothetical protein